MTKVLFEKCVLRIWVQCLVWVSWGEAQENDSASGESQEFEWLARRIHSVVRDGVARGSNYCPNCKDKECTGVERILISVLMNGLKIMYSERLVFYGKTLAREINLPDFSEELLGFESSKASGQKDEQVVSKYNLRVNKPEVRQSIPDYRQDLHKRPQCQGLRTETGIFQTRPKPSISMYGTHLNKHQSEAQSSTAIEEASIMNGETENLHKPITLDPMHRKDMFFEKFIKNAGLAKSFQKSSRTDLESSSRIEHKVESTDMSMKEALIKSINRTKRIASPQNRVAHMKPKRKLVQVMKPKNSKKVKSKNQRKVKQMKKHVTSRRRLSLKIEDGTSNKVTTFKKKPINNIVLQDNHFINELDFYETHSIECKSVDLQAYGTEKDNILEMLADLKDKRLGSITPKPQPTALLTKPKRSFEEKKEASGGGYSMDNWINHIVALGTPIRARSPVHEPETVQRKSIGYFK